jgi:hypothetical protein
MTQWGLDTLFNPAKRHMDEEKRRLQATREELGDSSGGKRIDLESGKVTIRRPNSEEDDEAATAGDAESTGDGPADAESTGDANAVADAPADRASAREVPAADSDSASLAHELTPAQLRAARRRGREPR